VIQLAALRGFLAGLDEPALRDLVAVVASQGHYDELALEVLLERNIAFTGLLASRRRAETVLGVLAQQGVSPERLAMIQNPVGIDIRARSPGEVAVSILAQIIAIEPNIAEPAADPVLHGAESSVEVDPVCGMEVEVAEALYRFDYLAQTYFFCGAHCRASFAAEPEHYLLQLGTT
jgi:xanthine dehydrogenase accessory factor